MIARRRNRLALLAAVALQATPALLQAQTSGTWINPFGGSWTSPNNWNSFPSVPGDGGVATFPAGSWNSTIISLPSSPITLSRIELNGPSVYSTFNSGSLVFAGPAILDVNGNTQSNTWVNAFGGAHAVARIVTSSGLIKNGNGVLLAASFGSISGGITVNGGTLIAGANYPLSASNGTVTLNGGALFSSDFGRFVDVAVAIGAGGGTIISGSSNVQFNSDVTGDSTLTLGRTSFGGFTLRSSAAFSGQLYVNSQLELVNSGALPSLAKLDLADSLLLTNSTTVNFNRVPDTMPLYLRGALLQATGSSVNPGIETLGPATLEGAVTQIVSNQYLDLNFDSISRSGRAILSKGNSTFTLRITGAAPALSGSGAVSTADVGIIPWARSVQGGISPLTFDSGMLRPLNSLEFVGTVPSIVATYNLKLTSDATMSSPGAVNSLTVVPGSSSMNFAGAGTLSISSGAMFLQGSSGNTSTTIGVPIHFGSVEGIIHTSTTASTGTVTLAGPISGSGGVTVAGSVTLSGTSSYTGATTINGRVRLESDVNAGSPGPLGIDASPVVINFNNVTSTVAATPMNGITLYPAPGGTILFNRDLIVRSDNPAVADSLNLGSLTGGAGSAEISGNIQLDGPLSLVGSAKPGSEGFVVSGQITGSGRLVNPSYVTLTGDNTFTGGVVMGFATLTAGSDTALGAGTLWFTNVDGARLSASAPITLSNPIQLSAPARIGGTQPITLAGPIDLYGGSRILYVDNTATTTITGDISNGSLTKSGTGLLNVSRVRIPKLTVSVGTVRILPNGTASGTSRLQALTISASAVSQLDLTNNNLILDYTGDIGSMLSTVQQDLFTSRLMTSMPADGHALGYADNSLLGLTLFAGQAVDPTSILIKYTFTGDANLDGSVNAVDLSSLATNWQSSAQHWVAGDFNYDGSVNIADLYLLALNWGKGAGPVGSLSAALARVDLPSTPIPEPGKFLAALLSVVFMTRRCRRDRNSALN